LTLSIFNKVCVDSQGFFNNSCCKAISEYSLSRVGYSKKIIVPLKRRVRSRSWGYLQRSGEFREYFFRIYGSLVFILLQSKKRSQSQGVDCSARKRCGPNKVYRTKPLYRFRTLWKSLMAIRWVERLPFTPRSSRIHHQHRVIARRCNRNPWTQRKRKRG